MIEVGEIAQSIAEVSGMLIDSMFSLPLDTVPHDNTFFNEGGFAASIRLTGGFNGTVTIVADRAGATAFASRLFASDRLSEEDLSDAIGEVSNMIGGSFKATFKHPADLGLPSHSPFVREIPPVVGEQLSEQLFSFGEHLMLVQVHRAY